MAGLGTRFLPTTKAMPKELVPIIDRPINQDAVEEALPDEITKLVFMTGRSRRTIADHFDAAPELEKTLEEAGNEALAANVREILPTHVDAIYIRQRTTVALGDAILCARAAISDATFAVFWADDFITPSHSTSNPILDLAEGNVAQQYSPMPVQNMATSRVHEYGIALAGLTPHEFAGLVEEPAMDEAPSSMASIGRYVVHPDVFEVLAALGPGKSGEIQLTDAIDALARRCRPDAKFLDERRHDCGSSLGYLGAVIAAVDQNGEFGVAFRGLMAAEVALDEQED